MRRAWLHLHVPIPRWAELHLHVQVPALLLMRWAFDISTCIASVYSSSWGELWDIYMCRFRSQLFMRWAFGICIASGHISSYGELWHINMYLFRPQLLMRPWASAGQATSILFRFQSETSAERTDFYPIWLQLLPLVIDERTCAIALLKVSLSVS